MQNKTKIIILILLIFTYVITNFSLGSSNVEPAKVNIQDKIPYIISGYHGKEQEIPEKVFSIIQPEEIMIRSYKKGNQEINLAVVVSENKEDLHAPEICYKLQGFQFNKSEGISISNGCRLTQVDTIKDDKPYIFHFYYTDMEKVYTNRAEFMTNIILSKILNKPRKKYALITSFTNADNNDDLKIFSEKINEHIVN